MCTTSAVQSADPRPARSLFMGQMSHCIASPADCIAHVRPGTPCVCVCARAHRPVRACPVQRHRAGIRAPWLWISPLYARYMCRGGQTLFLKLKGGEVEFRRVNPHLHPWFCRCVSPLCPPGSSFSSRGAGVANDPSAHSVPCSRPTRR